MTGDPLGAPRAVPRPAALTIPELIRAQVAVKPDAVALRDERQTVTFRELATRADRIANGLVAAGVGPGSRVLYLARNTVEFFELLLGTDEVGAVLVPVNWRLTASDIEFLVSDARPDLAFVDPEYAELVGGVPTIALDDGFAAWRDGQADTSPSHLPRPDDVVLQPYTSGTTGLPKGVLLTNENLSWLASAGDRMRIDATSRVLAPMPVHHTGGSAWGVIALTNGAELVVVNTFDPEATADLIARHRITNVALAPTIIFMMSERVRDADYSSLRSVVYGGQPMTPSTLARATGMFGDTLIQMYGMTECAGPVVQLDPEDHRGELLASAGLPYPWIEVAIHDPMTGEPVATRTQGEVWARSPQFTRGYWNRPEATAELRGPGGWIRSGDAGYLDENGYLYLTDRIKDLIITGGENVYPAEVERVLEEHPDVDTAAVIGVPHEKWGEAVTAIVALRAGAAATGDEIREWSRSRLSGFKRPQQVIVRDALPRTASGKVLRRELREPFWAGMSRRIG